MSSIGRISATAVFLAKRHTDSSMACPSHGLFGFAQAQRDGRHTSHGDADIFNPPSATRPSAAMHTLEIAWALRLRLCGHG